MRTHSSKGITGVVASILALPLSAYAAPPQHITPGEMTALFTANPELKKSFTTPDKLTAQFVKTAHGRPVYKVRARDNSDLIVTVQPPAGTASPDVVGTIIDIGIAVWDHLHGPGRSTGGGGCTTVTTSSTSTVDGHSTTQTTEVKICKT